MNLINKTEKKNYLEIAIRQINASCLENINADTMIACIKKQNCDKKWYHHVRAFLEELPPELIHDIVLSGDLTFEELNKSIDTWESMDGETTDWIREMAGLGMETTA